MIRLTDDMRKVAGVSVGAIWIGNNPDEVQGDLAANGIGAVLNVAQDMEPSRGWSDGIEYMHVGLVDGPGNEPCAYVAAVLALRALLKRHNVMVCCHEGGRSLAVAIMYLNVYIQLNGPYRRDWEEWITLLQERVDVSLPVPNEVHKQAWLSGKWSSVNNLMR